MTTSLHTTTTDAEDSATIGVATTSAMIVTTVLIAMIVTAINSRAAAVDSIVLSLSISKMTIMEIAVDIVL